ncbi:MAG: hypothetical protein MUP24_00860, partial [Gillisia sp.]|nr:hypothetical protein [Gillisia sp.]
MKKLSLFLIMLISISAFSQQKSQHQKADKTDMSAEETATLQAKKLTLLLDLNQAQQQEIKKLYQEKAEERKALIAERKKMSAEDAEKLKENRFERENARLDRELAHQEKMKQILNEEQYKKWKESRSGKHKHHYKNKR